MELKEYLKIIHKNLKLIAIVTLICLLASYVFTLKQPKKYEANFNFTIAPKTKTEAENLYTYGGYYELQAAALFGATITSWLSSPDIVAEIYKRIQRKTKNMNPKSLAKLIKSSYTQSSFSLSVRLREENEKTARQLALKTIEVIQEKTSEFNQKTESKTNFGLIASEPVIFEIAPKKEFNLLIGALAGLFLGIFLSFVREYLWG